MFLNDRKLFAEFLWQNYASLIGGGIVRARIHETAVRICRHWMKVVALNIVIASSIGYFISWGTSASLGFIAWLFLVIVMLLGVVFASWAVVSGMDNTEAELKLLRYFLDSYQWKGVKTSDSSKSK